MDFKALARPLAKYWYVFVLLAIVIVAFWIRAFPSRFAEFHELDCMYMYRIGEYLLGNNFHLPETDLMRAYPYGGHPLLQDPPIPLYLPTVLYSLLPFFGMRMLFYDFAFIVPPLFGALAVAVMFFLGKEIFNDRRAGLFASFFLATVPAFLTRTSSGFYDKECYAGFFLLLSILFFVRAYKRGSILSGIISGISLAILSLDWGGTLFVYGMYGGFALVILLLNRCPTGLVKAYIPTVVLGVVLSYLYPYHPEFTGVPFFAGMVAVLVVLRFLAERLSLVRREQLPYFTPAVIVLGLVAIMVAAMFLDPVGNIIQHFINSILVSKGTAGQTVAEQMPGEWGDITGAMGLGMMNSASLVPQLQPIANLLSPWIFVLIGTALMFYALYKKRELLMFLPIIWVIVGIYGVFGMIRLLFVLGPPAALVSGYFFSELIRHAMRLKVMENDKRIGWLLLMTGAIFFVSFLASLSQPMVAGMTFFISMPFLIFGYLLKAGKINTGTNILLLPLSILIALTLIVNTSTAYVQGLAMGPTVCFPEEGEVCVKYKWDGTMELSMRQPWYQAMDYLSKETPKNASVLSWWDFGYLFQSRGQRSSVSDGGGVGPREPVADWYVDRPENWNKYLDPLLRKYNVTHIVMDFTLPGKYGAISKIAYEGKAVYGYMEFPRQPTQIYPKENRTVYEFTAGGYALWVPLDDSGNLADTPMLLASQGGQFVGRVYINDLCTVNGIIHTGDREPSTKGCIAITPYKVYFVPPEVENTIFNYLMLMDGYGLPVTKVFDNYLIQIYEVEYPSEQPAANQTGE